MTTAFLAEVDTIKGTMYVSKKGKLSKVPFFFSQAGRLKDIIKLSTSRSYEPVDFYSNRRDQDKTRVIVVDNVELGLRASTGANLSVVDFMNREYGSGQYAPKKPKNAVFKIRIIHGSSHKYAGGGKFGKTWERQGDVRLHITNNLSRLTVRHVDGRIPYYKGAEVVMIELEADGITAKKITRTPIVDFYIQSPPCKKRIADLGQTSLSAFTGDTTKLSPYA